MEASRELAVGLLRQLLEVRSWWRMKWGGVGAGVGVGVGVGCVYGGGA